jgi:hypothetical protein
VKKKTLNAINNQCAVVQHCIALNYDAPDNEKLIIELLRLLELLKEFFGT